MRDISFKCLRLRRTIEVRKDHLKPKLPSDEESSLENHHAARLADAEREMDVRFDENSCPRTTLDDLKILGQIGSGGSSEVYMVRHSGDHRLYSLKVQPKARLSESKAEAIVREKKLLYALHCEFIVKLHFAFQDTANLYMMLEYAKYGDLESCSHGFSTTTLKFLAAQIILALEYLHACNVVHRDLMPKNVLIFEDGYLKLSDFGFARKLRDRAYSQKGTYAFMAPEMFGKQGYGKEVDWWALGVTLFRLMYKQHPFPLPQWVGGKLVHGIEDTGVDFPRGVNLRSPVCRFLSALLEKDLSKRLGAQPGGAIDIRRHCWFDEISFFDIENKSLKFVSTLRSVRAQPRRRYEFLNSESADKNIHQYRFRDF